ncbi:MAG TPA: ACT domain-containing protein, partial [Aquificae bacterium]|nr:ACT domain-containing protein [Aquificota bacterium]
FKNIDVPGVIGKVGTILGKHNINIAGFQLGRVGKGKEAKAVLIVDDDINEDALNELKNLKEITYVKFVKI